MIIKKHELNNLKNLNTSIYLLYGKNDGLKSKVIEENILGKSQPLVQRYEEKEILENKDQLISELINKSFFDSEKIFIVSRVSTKIIEFVSEILEKKLSECKIIKFKIFF